MDILALEAKGVKTEPSPQPAPQKSRNKAPKKPKRIVYFEVEILDAKTKEKLLLLDKVRPACAVPCRTVETCVFQP